MATIKLNEVELDALAGLGHAAFRLYVAAIRPRMDFASGTVGKVGVGISWQALKEWIYVEGRPGVKASTHSESMIRRLVKQLVKHGLVREIGDRFRIAFLCPLADTDSSVRKKADSKSTVQKTPGKPREIRESRRKQRAVEKAKADTHPKSGINNTPPNPPRAAELIGSGESVHLAPHADGAGGESDPQHNQAPGPRPSEQRHEQLTGGEKSWLAEEGSRSAVEWRDELAWPANLRDEDRRCLANAITPLGEALGQRVLDEWRGCIKAGGVSDEWAYLHALLRKAKEQGEAWKTDHAEKIAHAREQAKRTAEAQKRADEAFAASLAGKPGPIAKRGRLLQQFRENGYLCGASAKGV